MAALSLSCKPKLCSVAEKEIQTITWGMNNYSVLGITMPDSGLT